MISGTRSFAFEFPVFAEFARGAVSECLMRTNGVVDVFPAAELGTDVCGAHAPLARLVSGSAAEADAFARRPAASSHYLVSTENIILARLSLRPDWLKPDAYESLSHPQQLTAAAQ